MGIFRSVPTANPIDSPSRLAAIFGHTRTALGGPDAAFTASIAAHYSLRPKELASLLREAWLLDPACPRQALASLLERQLENVVFRLGFAGNIPEARSLVRHGHILLNRHAPRKDSHISLWPGDVVHFTPHPYDATAVTALPWRSLPSYLQYLNPHVTDRAIVLSLPAIDDVPIPTFKAAPARSCAKQANQPFQEASMADHRILLAHSEQGAILACQCGAIHIVIGDSMVSFSLEEFVVMLELHHQALSSLEENIVAVRDLCMAGSAPLNTDKTIH